MCRISRHFYGRAGCSFPVLAKFCPGWVVRGSEGADRANRSAPKTSKRKVVMPRNSFTMAKMAASECYVELVCRMGAKIALQRATFLGRCQRHSLLLNAPTAARCLALEGWTTVNSLYESKLHMLFTTQGSKLRMHERSKSRIYYDLFCFPHPQK